MLLNFTFSDAAYRFIIFLSIVANTTAWSQVIVDSGHAERVAQVLISPDSKYLVTADFRGKVVVRNLASKQPVVEFRLSNGYMTMHGNMLGGSLAFSTDGKFLAVGRRSDESAGYAGTVELFQSDSFQSLAKIEIPHGPADSPYLEEIRFITNNQLIAVNDYEINRDNEPFKKRKATVWNVANGRFEAGDPRLIYTTYDTHEKFGLAAKADAIPKDITLNKDLISCGEEGRKGIAVGSDGLYEWEVGSKTKLILKVEWPKGHIPVYLNCSQGLDTAWIVIGNERNPSEDVWIREKTLYFWRSGLAAPKLVARMGRENIDSGAIVPVNSDLILAIGKNTVRYSSTTMSRTDALPVSGGSITKLDYVSAQDSLLIDANYSYYLGGEGTPEANLTSARVLDINGGRQIYSSSESVCPRWGIIIIECAIFNGGYKPKYTGIRNLITMKSLPLPNVLTDQGLDQGDILAWSSNEADVLAQIPEGKPKEYTNILATKSGSTTQITYPLLDYRFIAHSDQYGSLISQSLGLATSLDEEKRRISVIELKANKILGGWDVPKGADDSVEATDKAETRFLVIRRFEDERPSVLFIRNKVGEILSQISLADTFKDPLVAFRSDEKGVGIVAKNGAKGQILDWEFSTRKQRTIEFYLIGLSTAIVGTNKGFAVGTDEGTVHLLNENAEYARYFAFADGDWLLMNSQGYYTASNSVVAQRIYQINARGGRYRLDSLEEKFYRPDLVQAALQTGKIITGLESLADVQSAPLVTLIDTPTSSTSEEITLKALLTDLGGGVGQYRLLINGTVVEERELQELGPISLKVRLRDGENNIRLIALNRSKTMKSAPAQALVVLREKTVKKPVFHALIIGINSFENSRYDLKYAVPDAKALADRFVYKPKDFFSAYNVKLLISPQNTTKAFIEEALRTFRTVDPDDVFLFYMATHGVVEGEDIASRELFLFTSDVGATGARALKNTALSQNEIKLAISNIPTSKKVIVLDACHSGAFGDPTAITSRGLNEDAALKILSSSTGVIVYSASTSSQEALEGIDGHGLFTHSLLKALNGNADRNKRGYVSTIDIAGYIQDEVPRLSKQHFQRSQFPTYYLNGQDFPLIQTP